MRAQRKECISMLLAGGQGSRLYVLTEKNAKPAVPFGGKYRIIDFSLSNCTNSGIDTVGILTQYQPLELNRYIGDGGPWGLNRTFGGVHVLPPYMKSDKGEWYKGTANAIYQNIPFIEEYNPEYVLILSGDHIYKMDYAKMLAYHKRKKADCTIAVREVPMKDASQMGIMSAEKNGRITEFEEKPKEPKSNLASMGVYIFNWSLLKQYLEEDEADKNSNNDFGKNVIPAMLNTDRRMFAYRFDGYWKDVGTLNSLWQANMDIVDQNGPIKLDDPSWKIYSRNYAHPSSVICRTGSVKNSLISEGSVIAGTVTNSVIYSGCTIKEGAVVEKSVIMPNTVIESGSVVSYAIVGEKTVVGENVVIGKVAAGENNPEITVVGNNEILADGTKIAAGKIV